MDRTPRAGIDSSNGESRWRGDDRAESQRCCALNLTRGCLLGIEIASGDFPRVTLVDQIPALTAKSGTGIWLLPFRGILASDARVPLDLIYLDDDCRVIETVEFFPTYRASPSSPPAASVLALPVHAIYASHTQSGDQLVFGRAEEIDRRLKELYGSSAVEVDLPPPETPAKSALPETQRAKGLALVQPAAPAKAATEPATKVEPWKKDAAKPKGWLQRWLNPEPEEPRKAARAALAGLTAYFWTGAAPKAHAIRNISTTGLYVITEERWYPGTLVQMTLKRSDEETGAETSISLLVRAHRWGNDGVGLSFVVRDPRNPRAPDSIQEGAIDRAMLYEFLARIGHENG
ncbi:MAG: hypothetical protein ABR907_04025 [Terracidiphilus sp.]